MNTIKYILKKKRKLHILLLVNFIISPKTHRDLGRWNSWAAKIVHGDHLEHTKFNINRKSKKNIYIRHQTTTHRFIKVQKYRIFYDASNALSINQNEQKEKLNKSTSQKKQQQISHKYLTKLTV